MTPDGHDASLIAGFLADEGALVNPAISPDDVMHRTAPDHYFPIGRAALGAIRLSILAVGNPRPIRTILDLPCGHGRVLRTLSAAFPDAVITACDLDREAVDFCAEVLGAVPAYSDPDPGRVSLTGPFDLIWCGSLLTHLDAPLWPGFLDLFGRVLAPGGVLVFTAHGPHIARNVREGSRSFSLAHPERFVTDFDETGFAYRDYEGWGGYGISMATPAWVASCLEDRRGLSLAGYAARGWHGQHDVFTCTSA